MSHIRLVVSVVSILALTGCVVAPPPPAYSYGYAYPAPAYVAGPTVAVGVGGGWDRGGYWHR